MYNFLAIYWSYFGGIQYASNCKFDTNEPVWIETNKKFLDCLKQLRSSNDFTHFDYKDQTCRLKKGFVNTQKAVFVKENVFCAYDPEKISTNNINRKKIFQFNYFNIFQGFWNSF